MNFRNGVTPLGAGSAVYAKATGAKAVILLKNGGITGKEIDLNTKAVRDLGVVSLADECALIGGGKVEKLGHIYFVPGMQEGEEE